MGCELDKVVEAINKVASGIKNPQAINQLNELKSDLNRFALNMEVDKPVRDFSKLKSVMSNVEVKATTNVVRPEFDKLPTYKEGQKTMTYAGIGSRETPPEILEEMTNISKILASKGYKLQTGNTFYNKEEGADKAFSQGTKNKELFGPEFANDRTITIAKELHPAPDRLKEGGLKLMARSTNQVFGKNLDTPVDFVLFYAKENEGSIRPEGGTGQAVEMARLKRIPTINMINSDWKEQLDKVLSSKGDIDKEEGSSSTTLVSESIVNSKKKDAIIAPINSQTARSIQGCNK